MGLYGLMWDIASNAPNRFTAVFKLVTGSYAGWLLSIIHQYLEAGRLQPIDFSPYFTSVEGLQAVYTYAQFYGEEITNDTAVQINELCMADTFFIFGVIQSQYANKNLATQEGVINTLIIPKLKYKLTIR